MRQFQETEKRWSLLFNTSLGVDLRQAVRDDGDFDPCEDGLRSVCWKSFLLNGPLSKASWTKKLKDSRSAYNSLRDHFLKFIDNPNNLHSSIDPLADDETSPWATLRQDESNREEIWQDVIRCNIDNFFFREPSTQRKLLDILFIYSKLNPDTGYRQGMHELLAPVLWTVYQDSVNVKSVSKTVAEKEGADFMLDVLDSIYVEHDAFNLFCAIMQTAKTFYELGDGKNSSAIVVQSERIHKDLLGAVDPDLCHHLQVVGVIPQIFAIRWLRLLFGREFEFKDVLKLWDMLFAETLNLDIIDMACVAVLLRLRWQLIDADYTSAITTLTRLNLPKEGDSARAVVKDAVQLTKQRTVEMGAEIIQLRTGKRPYVNPLAREESITRTSTPPQVRTHRKVRSSQTSSSPSPARFANPPRQLENLFNNVSTNFQKGAEGWSVQNVSKALRGAVGEVRRNVEQLQAGGSHSRNTSVDVQRNVTEDEKIGATPTAAELTERLKQLEQRNTALAQMLETAQETLRKWKLENATQTTQGEDAFNTALAKIQFVSVYLTDSEIPVPISAAQSPTIHNDSKSTAASQTEKPIKEEDNSSDQDQQSTKAKKPLLILPSSPLPEQKASENKIPSKSATDKSTTTAPLASGNSISSGGGRDDDTQSSSTTRPARPSLAESSFSFMLGSSRHSPSFVRSKPSPEERRMSEATAAAAASTTTKERKNSIDSTSKKLRKEKKISRGERETRERGNDDDENDDGFTMSSLHGGSIAGPL